MPSHIIISAHIYSSIFSDSFLYGYVFAPNSYTYASQYISICHRYLCKNLANAFKNVQINICVNEYLRGCVSLSGDLLSE